MPVGTAATFETTTGVQSGLEVTPSSAFDTAFAAATAISYVGWVHMATRANNEGLWGRGINTAGNGGLNLGMGWNFGTTGGVWVELAVTGNDMGQSRYVNFQHTNMVLAGSWQFLALVVDLSASGNARFRTWAASATDATATEYAPTQVVGSTSMPANFSTMANEDFKIGPKNGFYHNNNSFAIKRFREVSVYDFALTPAQVASFFNGGSAATPTDVGVTPILYVPFDPLATGTNESTGMTTTIVGASMVSSAAFGAPFGTPPVENRTAAGAAHTLATGVAPYTQVLNRTATAGLTHAEGDATATVSAPIDETATGAAMTLAAGTAAATLAFNRTAAGATMTNAAGVATPGVVTSQTAAGASMTLSGTATATAIDARTAAGSLTLGAGAAAATSVQAATAAGAAMTVSGVGVASVATTESRTAAGALSLSGAADTDRVLSRAAVGGAQTLANGNAIGEVVLDPAATADAMTVTGAAVLGPSTFARSASGGGMSAGAGAAARGSIDLTRDTTTTPATLTGTASFGLQLEDAVAVGAGMTLADGVAPGARILTRGAAGSLTITGAASRTVNRIVTASGAAMTLSAGVANRAVTISRVGTSTPMSMSAAAEIISANTFALHGDVFLTTTLYGDVHLPHT